MVFWFVLFLSWLVVGCGRHDKVVVFCAGSLTRPLEEVAAEFERSYGVRVEIEASGSRVAAKKISELGRNADVVALADWRLFPQLLYPKHCRWFAKFATNRLVLACSKKARPINQKNWLEVLAAPQTRWGHADPDADPCGYRALLALQLAEKLYRKKGLYNLLLKHKGRLVRPKSVELVTLLQAGELDYAFEYASVAVQHGLRYIELPAQVNLGEQKWADFYKNAELRLSDSTVVVGEPIVYGVGVTRKAQNPEAALAFVKMLLSDVGRRIFKRHGQKQITPVFFGDTPRELQGR